MVEIFENIRKIYQFGSPCGELTDYIDFYSQSCPATTSTLLGDTSFTVKMFASYTPTFWINLGSAYNLSLDNQLYTVGENEDVLVVRDSITERINRPEDSIFTVKFFPGALENILGLNQSKMAGKKIPLYHVLPAALIQQIKMAKDFEARVQLIESFLLIRKYNKKAKEHFANIVRQSIGFFQQENMQPNVNALAERSFITSKTITRYFNSVVGTTPKHYFSVLRSRTALTAYVTNRISFDPAHFGFYDLSHFHKEASRFIGHRLADVLL